MQCRRLVLLVASLFLGTVGPTGAQHPKVLGAMPTPFKSWRATIEMPSSTARVQQFQVTRKNRTHQALVGGAIGAAAGLIGCTVISTLANDSAGGGLSFCPLDSYLLIGGAGFLLGAAIGWVL